MNWRLEKNKDSAYLNNKLGIGLVVLLWAVHAVSLYFWLSTNQFATGWDRPKHLVSTLIFDQMLRPLNIVSLFKVFSLNIGYYPPLFPLSVVPLYRIFGISADVAGMVNVIYMLVLLLSLYGIGRKLYDIRIGLFSAFLGAMSPFLFSMAHYTYIDYALTAMITLAVFLLLCTDSFRNGTCSILFGVVLGLGMLYKWTPALFISGPLLLVLIGMLRSERLLPRMVWPWRQLIVAVLAGLILTWLWYTPNADLAATLLLGNWLPVLSFILIAATTFALLLPGSPVINVLRSFSIAVLLTSLWYLPRADMFRDILSIVVGGRADRPDYFDLSAYIYYPSRLISEGLSWPLFLLVAVLLVIALYHFIRRLSGSFRYSADSSLEQVIAWPDVFVILWFGLPFIVATFSTHREVRSVLPLMSPIAVATSCLIFGIRRPVLRRFTVGIVSLFLIIQFFVLNFSGLAQVARATETDNFPLLGKAGFFAYGEHIQWADMGDHDNRYWVMPDILDTIMSDSESNDTLELTGNDSIILGLLLNSRAINEYNIDYLIRTRYPDIAVENLARNRDLYPGYARAFGCDYLLMRDNPDSSEPADVIQSMLNEPPPFFAENFSLLKAYPWPNGETLYLFKNETHQIPERFGAEWLSPIENVMEVDLGDELRLLGYNMDTSQIASNGKLLITLYWMGLKPTDEDYSMHLKLFNGVKHVWGEQEGRPRWDASLTSDWKRGQVVEDIRELPVWPGTPPGAYTVEVLVRGLREDIPLEPVDAEELLLGPVQLPAGPVPDIGDLDMDRALDVSFGDSIDLLGYHVESGFQPGDGIHLTLFWQAQSDIEQDYVIFNHLVGEDGQVYNQKDNPPVDGYYRTTQWEAGEIVRDRYDLEIPVSAPEQEYEVLTGIYLPETGQRLPIDGSAGQTKDNAAILLHFEIPKEKTNE